MSILLEINQFKIYPIFEAMQEVDMVLNLHGEVPSDANAVGISLL